MDAASPCLSSSVSFPLTSFFPFMCDQRTASGRGDQTLSQECRFVVSGDVVPEGVAEVVTNRNHHGGDR